MDQVTRTKMIARVKKYEGFRSFPYTDTTGHLSIGFGRNLQTTALQMDEAYLMLENDLIMAERSAWRYFPGFVKLDDARKSVIIEMAFNMGINKLLKFTNMIDALDKKDYSLAADEMLKSKWHDQVGARAQDLAIIMRTGNF